MPSEIVFATGAAVKVVADVDAVVEALDEDALLFETERFAGFRGDEVVGGERVVVQLDAIAYVQAISAP
jgi:hypothetical protein